MIAQATKSICKSMWTKPNPTNCTRNKREIWHAMESIYIILGQLNMVYPQHFKATGSEGYKNPAVQSVSLIPKAVQFSVLFSAYE